MATVLLSLHGYIYCIATNLYPQSTPYHLCRSARRNSAYSEEPDGGLLLELALNPHLQQLSSESSVSVRGSGPMISPMPSEDGSVAGNGKAASIPAVVLDLPPTSPTLSSGPRYQDQVV